jgi:putative transposase
MKDYLTLLNHTKWDYKYHLVFIPKRHKKRIYGHLRRELGMMFHVLAQQKESQIVEGHVQPDHVHMCIQIPPKFAVSNMIGFLKGKMAIAIARDLMGWKENFSGENFWARGYFVTQVGLDEEMVREYIRKQEDEEERQDQLKLNL